MFRIVFVCCVLAKISRDRNLNHMRQSTERYTLADLQRWEQLCEDSDPPIRAGVFGDPVAHSLSPQMQNAALRACGISMQYARFHIRPGELRSALRLVRKLDFVGVNLTLPHKRAGLAQVDEADEFAARAGAVNTICLRSGKLIGSNTDGEGFERAIRSEFAVPLRDLRIMILGAGGGTGRAIAWQCALENCQRLVLVNRTVEKAQMLAQELRLFCNGKARPGGATWLEVIEWEELAMEAQLGKIDLIVNATPLGMNPSDVLPVPAGLLASQHAVFDCIYQPRKTALLSAAEQAGARVANGLSMLLQQGALSFSIWFQREAPIDAMSKALPFRQ